MKEIKAFTCSDCGEVFTSKYFALQCELKHAQVHLANEMFENGYTLKSINYQCGFNWSLKKEVEDVTKDSCFIFSHWQCCDKPAYQIIRIEYGGVLNVSGSGGWAGNYGDCMFPDKLPTPHPKEELYKYVG